MVNNRCTTLRRKIETALEQLARAKCPREAFEYH